MDIKNYYYIIGIGLFILFALIGYLVEISKKYKELKKTEKKKSEVKSDNIVIENDKEELLIDNDILNK